MAQNVQSVTLSLTLPITCHICLGKVRHPVICANNHVFCSICIEVWLKNNSQCPACRIPITPDNPCKEVLGGTSESNPVFSPAVRKQLRKTRLEILHKEYEDEIESLQKELETLKGENLSLESQLKSVLHPETLQVPERTQESPEPSDNEHKVDAETLAAWTQKLQAANDMYEKVKEDMEKLMERVVEATWKFIQHPAAKKLHTHWVQPSCTTQVTLRTQIKLPSGLNDSL